MPTEPWSGWTMLRRPPAHQSQPVKWWLLISAMEDFTVKTHLGLSDVWAAVHRGDYTTARQRFTWWVGYHDGLAASHWAGFEDATR